MSAPSLCHGHREQIRSLHQQANRAGHRYAVALVGSSDWNAAVASELIPDHKMESGLWVTSSRENPFSIPDAVYLPGSEARHQLGTEFDYCVFAMDREFDPDALGILGSTIRAGGVLILLIPDTTGKQEALADPTRSIFLERFRCRLAYHDVLLIEEKQRSALPRPNVPPPGPDDFNWQGPATTADQELAVQAVEKVVSGQRKRPVVLISDRGRGKSAALGMAAGKLVRSRGLRIGVTAPGRRNVDALFRHCDVPNKKKDADVRFYPTHKLLEKKRKIDLLLIDEAAAIPIPMLEKLLDMYSRIAFSTTVHGYEGTGRGFMTRFRKILDDHTRGWKQLKMDIPVRWAANDPVEALLFDTLLLDAEPQDNPGLPEGCMSGNLDIREIEKPGLIGDEPGLRNIYGLLSQAHYRTRPADLKHFLDSNSTDITVACQGDSVVGAMVTSREGGFALDRAKLVWENKIRPKDNILPEIIAVRCGVGNGAALNYRRVVRIVVHPALQGRGIGSTMLSRLGSRAETDIVGACFGAGVDALGFWRKNGYQAVFTGSTQSHNTGLHTIACIKPTTATGNTAARAAVAHFTRGLPLNLARNLRDLDSYMTRLLWPDTVMYSESSVKPPERLDLLNAFAFGRRGLEDCLADLQALLLAYMGQTDPRDPTRLDIGLLIEKVLQGRPWSLCTSLPQPAGKKLGLEICRKIVGQILVEVVPDQTNTGADP